MGHTIFTRYFTDETSLISLLDFPYISLIKPGIEKFKGEKHYLATAEVDNDELNFDAPFIDYENRENRANMHPIINSVWFAKMKKSIKHICLSAADDYLIQNYIFSTGFCGINCADISYEYIVNYIRLPYFELKKDILAHGATQEGVNNEDLKLLMIHLPSKIKLTDFHNKTKQIYVQISKINQESYRLKLLKNKLLPLLINGQLQ